MKYLGLLENFRCIQLLGLFYCFFCCLVYSSEKKVTLCNLSRLFIGQYCAFFCFLIATRDILTNIIYFFFIRLIVISNCHAPTFYRFTSQQHFTATETDIILTTPLHSPMPKTIACIYFQSRSWGISNQLPMTNEVMEPRGEPTLFTPLYK